MNTEWRFKIGPFIFRSKASLTTAVLCAVVVLVCCCCGPVLLGKIG